jgi:electron transfer flavoprotein alpha subunit
MPGAVWVVGEVTGGGLARIAAEAATAARGLAEASSRDVVGVVVGPGGEGAAGAAATELAAYVPRVLRIDEPALADAAWATVAATRLATLAERERPSYILVGATPDGRDLAGVLSALLGWGVLVNASGIAWEDAGPVVEMTVFGGRLVTRSAFTGDHGIVTLRPGTATSAPLGTTGTVEVVTVAEAGSLPRVPVVEHAAEAGAAAPIEEAKIIVAGGRGVGGPDGFALVGELAEELGGVIGASRAAVDSGWIPYARQIGQTGKIVKPALYVALGISGAIQHKVGMQAAGTIVAVNRDPDAPLAEFADLYVVGDLFEVVPAVLAELRSRRG